MQSYRSNTRPKDLHLHLTQAESTAVLASRRLRRTMRVYWTGNSQGVDQWNWSALFGAVQRDLELGLQGP